MHTIGRHLMTFLTGGFMEKLDKQWIFHGHVQQNCELFEKTPNTLGLKNMAGVFILVGVGIAGGVGLIITFGLWPGLPSS